MGLDSSIQAADPASSGPSSDRYVRHVHSKDFKTFVFDLVTAAFACAMMYVITKKTMSSMDPTKNSKKTQETAKAVISRLGKKKGDVDLNDHEQVLIGEVAMPNDITVNFKSIGGLDAIKSQLIETILIPLSRPELFAKQAADGTLHKRSLVSPPRGVLFYGPPGTGKTMTAKAIARDSGATFINLRWSTVKNKWYGESQKLVRAVFTLAEKLSPSIIFIDEAECFLGQRSAFNEHSESNALKAEFMSLWDGLLSDSAVSKHVLVLCATNRPFDLDEAILRRMPRTFEFPMPDQTAREAILRVLLVDEHLNESVEINTLAELTPSYSGSDLKEWCRFAAMIPIREILRRQGSETTAIFELRSQEEQPRALTLDDFVESLEHVKPSGSTASEYKFNRAVAAALSS